MNLKRLVKIISFKWFIEIIQKLGSRPIMTSFFVFVLCTIGIVWISNYKYQYNSKFVESIFIEAHGMLFDIFIIGIFIFGLHKLGEKRLNNKRYQEEINDFESWGSEEAKFRIVGNIKRLNRNNISKIDLVGCYLKKAELRGANLRDANLQGANLDGANLHKANLRGANLEKVNLQGVKYLTIEQLSKAKTLYKVKFDPYIKKQIEAKYSHLLEEPEREEEIW